MIILVDTNILIGREGNFPVPKETQELIETVSKLFPHVELIIHPASIEDIHNDKYEARQKITLSKLEVYRKLEDSPKYDQDSEFIKFIGKEQSNNDKIDNLLIYSVYRNAVDFLVTEDKGILEKAKRLNLEKRILCAKECKSFIQTKFKNEKIITPPALKEVYCHSLDLKDPFFDSLKKDYPEFDAWWSEKVCKKQRKCFVHLMQDSRISSLLLLKFEENEKVQLTDKTFFEERIVKICTFKSDYAGHYIGELFLKIAFKYAIDHSCSKLYLTHFTITDDPLIILLRKFGFYLVGRNKRGEEIYFKDIICSAKNNQDSIDYLNSRYYPSFYDGIKVKKFLVPIVPRFHERLFIEYKNRQTKITEHDGQFIIEGNTIKKAYLSNSKIKKISKNDLLLFYKSKSTKEITSVGVVEEIHLNLTDAKAIRNLVKSRTVYTDEELSKLGNKKALLILFKWCFNFPKQIPVAGISPIPQSIVEMSHEKYLKAKTLSNLDSKFTIQ